MKVIIMAGGRGTRIRSIAEDIPKPMIPILNKPILQYQIENMRNQGYNDFIIIIGHLGRHIKEYFGNGEFLGVNIEYFTETVPLGTAGALSFLKDKLCEDFFLLNGDIIFDIDFKRFLSFHNSKKGLASILTHPNGHPYDSALIKVDNNSMVTSWVNKEDKRDIYKNRVNAGIHILNPKLIDRISVGEKTDLDRQILKPLISENAVYAYDSPEYVKDMGTPERYIEVAEDINLGIVKLRSLKYKQKAVFLDRDGTLNKYKGFISHRDDLELLDNISEAICIINKSEYLAIVITNQPVVARGECSFDELDNINMKLETLLGNNGAYIDDLFYCPHHPDKGFDGEVIELKIDCDCRKPKAGLLVKAANKYNIDLSQSFMVGDHMRDVIAGINAGCKSILLSENENVFGDFEVYSDLLDFTKHKIN